MRRTFIEVDASVLRYERRLPLEIYLDNVNDKISKCKIEAAAAVVSPSGWAGLAEAAVRTAR